MKPKHTSILVIALLTIMSCKAGSKSASAKDSEPMNNPYYSTTDTTKLDVPDATWKKILPPDVYAVAREADTEYAFTGKYWNFTGLGTYFCAVCGNKLFRSDEKFASSCGWPSFFETSRPGAAIYRNDSSLGMERIE